MKMNKIDLKNLDKSKWSTFNFDQIASSISERVDPNNTDLKHYIGLEHLDSENIHITRMGSPDDVSGQKLRCYPGDVIFGRRRAYQRKAAVCDVDGFCSAHSLVLRANPEVIDPRLFPFFLHSDRFMHRAVDISVGSLSPTINWGTLKTQKFVIPDKALQSQLIDLFTASDVNIQAEKQALSFMNKCLEAKVEELIHGVDIYGKTINEVLSEAAKSIRLTPLNELGEIIKGSGIPKSDLSEYGIPCVRYGELYTKHHRIIREYHSFIPDGLENKGVQLRHGDVLFASSGETIEEIGKSASLVFDDEVYAGGDILIFRPHDMDAYFSGFLMNSLLVRHQLNKYGSGATVMHIYKSDLEKIKVPELPIDEQKSIGKILNDMSENIYMIENMISTSKILQDSLINQVF